MKNESEARVAARIDGKVKLRLGKVAGQLGISESDLVRMGILWFLPQFEQGKIDLRTLKKAA